MSAGSEDGWVDRVAGPIGSSDPGCRARQGGHPEGEHSHCSCHIDATSFEFPSVNGGKGLHCLTVMICPLPSFPSFLHTSSPGVSACPQAKECQS